MFSHPLFESRNQCYHLIKNGFEVNSGSLSPENLGVKKIDNYNLTPKPIAKAKFGYIQEFINGTIVDLSEFKNYAVPILSRIHKIKLNSWHNTISPISVIEFYWNSLADFQKNPAIKKKKIFY